MLIKGKVDEALCPFVVSVRVISLLSNNLRALAALLIIYQLSSTVGNDKNISEGHACCPVR